MGNSPRLIANRCLALDPGPQPAVSVRRFDLLDLQRFATLEDRAITGRHPCRRLRLEHVSKHSAREPFDGLPVVMRLVAVDQDEAAVAILHRYGRRNGIDQDPQQGLTPAQCFLRAADLRDVLHDADQRRHSLAWTEFRLHLNPAADRSTVAGECTHFTDLRTSIRAGDSQHLGETPAVVAMKHAGQGRETGGCLPSVDPQEPAKATRPGNSCRTHDPSKAAELAACCWLVTLRRLLGHLPLIGAVIRPPAADSRRRFQRAAALTLVRIGSTTCGALTKHRRMVEPRQPHPGRVRARLVARFIEFAMAL